MAFVAGPVNSLSSLSPGRDTWKLKVRVLRSWEMCPIGEPGQPYALNHVFIDSEGGKIEAIVKKTLIVKFRGQLREGNVYKITYFHVALNSGNYRATDNQYKIFFNGRTKIVGDNCDSIPINRLTLKDSAFVEASKGQCDFLIDVVGVVTAVSKEKQFVKGETVTRKIELEITDDKGKVLCALFGDYVDMVNAYMSSTGSELPIVVVQFAKIKKFRDDIVIQNVMNATKVHWNSDMAEVASFRSGIAVHGFDLEIPLREIDDWGSNSSLEDEFLKLFPRKNLNELHSTFEEGMFIVSGKINGLIEDEKWWYPSCRCHKGVSLEDGLYFCPGCSTYVFEVTPRYKIKVEVLDNIDSATFVLFDNDCQQILQKPCKDVVFGPKGLAVDDIPESIKAMIGKTYLFKVEKSSDHGAKFDDSYKVKKICCDPRIIEIFNDNFNMQTPLKLIKKASKSISSAEGSAELSECISEVVPDVVSLDEITPLDGSASCSSPKTKESSNGRPKRIRFTPVKFEKF